ncbi:hypothetical protein VE03_07254 [Pseudogymnoascus sp. 23342-1-I1]|nr:hypothetical protein VE03_07254 [Pseudogymnoascus sp. 23342-1-I1]
MPLFDARDILSFPSGNNASDTIIGGINFNLTTLQHWNYTLYSNGTLSNNSNCFLTFDPYTPHLLPNGTFLNTTSCYSPLKGLGNRAKPGIALGVFFGLSLVFTMINLRKHGKLFLPSEKRFVAIGRRWQWYWMLWVAACGMASGFTSVDVDRYYLPEWPLILNSIFWYLMIPSTLAIVWESVRHWGSWQERQLIDPDPFVLSQNDERGRREFYMPLVFYGFGFLHFFMSVPRNWTPISYQRSPSQALQIAAPQATDGRFKSAAFFLLLAWLTILFSLLHSMHHYTPRPSLAARILSTPPAFLLTLPLTLTIVAYQFLAAFSFAHSPLNLAADPAIIYALGWAPIVLIFVIHEVAGYAHPNEDRELIRQRRRRGQDLDREMGYTRKPPWWRRLNGHHNLTVQQALARNAQEVSGAPKAADGQGMDDVEMSPMPPPSRRNAEREIRVDNTPAGRALARREGRREAELDERVREAARALFPGPQQTGEGRKKEDVREYLMGDDLDGSGRGRPGMGTGTGGEESGRSGSTGSVASTTTTMVGVRPQVVRSMLDI